MKKLFVIHTSDVSLDYLKTLFQKIIPEVQVYNIVDDSLLDEIMKNNCVTKSVAARFCTYALQAQYSGADLILSQCSSAGPAADIASRIVDVPVLKIDQAMAEEAVTRGSRIAVIGTVSSTMLPSTELIRSVAREKGLSVEVTPYLVDGALDILMKENNRQKHNHLILEQIRAVTDCSDVVVFAQGSMVSVLDDLGDTKIPVLTSPEIGVRRARKELGLP